MRADFENSLKAYRQPPPPGEIWQEPFDYYPDHYEQLCALDGAMACPSDVWAYANDLCYQKIQPDLFAYLLPICLQAWQHDLYHYHNSDYAGFVEQFSAALARRWPHLQTLLNPGQAETVMVFMRDSVLDMIDRETSLSHEGMPATPYAWTHGLGSFAVIFPNLESLWRIWWRFETPGQVTAALQYISGFMYEDDANPIFAPWTPDGGGGPPCPWGTDGYIYDECWHLENVEFFKSTVTPEYVHNRLARAAEVLSSVTETSVPVQMLANFERQKPLLQHRLQAFPKIVSQPLVNAPIHWPPPA